ncbi:hypothetical protein NC651_027845 [Populus alba x Populus x berolinensis]|nr:hypothetical protein NC651_027845 [Populus alba x Populus x berolinensis]
MRLLYYKQETKTTKLPKSNPLPQRFVSPTTPAATQRQPCVPSLASVVHPAPAVSLANHPLCIALSLPLSAGSLFTRNTTAKLLHPRLVTATAAEGTHLSFPPRLKQQSPASATPLHFQQQPALLSGGNTNFSDLSGSHREQQQLFLLNHGCRHPSSALARMKAEERERENRENKRPEGKTEQKKKRGKTEVV